MSTEEADLWRDPVQAMLTSQNERKVRPNQRIEQCDVPQMCQNMFLFSTIIDIDPNDDDDDICNRMCT